MGAFAAGQVVLLAFPFSDLSRSKFRPSLLLAPAGRGDWIACQITSNPYADPRAIQPTDAALASGGLQRPSFVRPGKLFTAHESLMEPAIGEVLPDALARVRAAVVVLLQDPRPCDRVVQARPAAPLPLLRTQPSVENPVFLHGRFSARFPRSSLSPGARHSGMAPLRWLNLEQAHEVSAATPRRGARINAAGRPRAARSPVSRPAPRGPAAHPPRSEPAGTRSTPPCAPGRMRVSAEET